MSVERLPSPPPISPAGTSSSSGPGARIATFVLIASLSVAIPFGVVATSFLFRLAAARITVALALGLITLLAPVVGIALAPFAIVRSRPRRSPVVLVAAILGILLNVFFLGAIGYRAAFFNTHARRGHASQQSFGSPTAQPSALTPVV